MRNTKLHTICILALGSILTIGFEANAQLDPNMEAAVDCSVAECMFRGNSQPHDAIAGFQRLPSNGGEARMFKINRYADNPDQAVDRRVENQFNAVGQIETLGKIANAAGQEGIGTATAFIVSPCYVLTNNHAVFGDAFPSQPKNDAERTAIGDQYKVKFSVGVGRAVSFAGSVTATPVAWGRRTGTNENDWALLKMSSCLGTRSEIGWMDIDVNQTASGLNGKKVGVASYPSDRGADAEAGKSLQLSIGKVTGYNEENKTYRYAASTAPGSSGGIVVAKGSDGGMKVIGMHRGGHRNPNDLENHNFQTYSDDYSNEFINIRDIIQSQNVRGILADDFLKFGKGNPNTPNLRRAIPTVNGQSTI